MPKPFLITGIRGRNGQDAPLMVPEDQACEAVNVDFAEGSLVHRRAGSAAIAMTFSSGGPFNTRAWALLRHLPGSDDTLAELWAVDEAGQICRLAGGVTWTEPTLTDLIASSPAEVVGVSLGGFLFLYYDSTQNRSHVWDPVLGVIRRTGFAAPAAPTLATMGGSGLTFTRYYRTRYLDISGSDTRRQSEPSASATISITDDAGVTVTRGAALSEGETHWLVEYADSDAGPWYVASGNIVIATTTYSDTMALVDELELSEAEGVYPAPPSFKYAVRGGSRLLQAGAWETSGGSFVPLATEVYWTPVLGATDVGDLERQPISYRVSLDHPVNGLSEAVNGIHYAFGFRGISALIPTGEPGEGAFQRITERLDIGSIRHHAIVTADNEGGNPCVYFLDARGPYRIGPAGLQYLGHDIEDIWDTLSLSASTNAVSAHGVYYKHLRQIWWWISATPGTNRPLTRIVFDTSLGQVGPGGDIRGGWSVHDGEAANSLCSTMFAGTIGAAMSYDLVPYFGPYNDDVIWRGDTGTDDAGTDYQAYLDTREYAPAGLGTNCTLSEPHIVGQASATAQVSVTMRTDFGLHALPTKTISLAPDASETHVQRKLDGLQQSGIGTVRFRIGDAAATDPGFGTLDALVAFADPAEGR